MIKHATIFFLILKFAFYPIFSMANYFEDANRQLAEQDWDRALNSGSSRIVVELGEAHQHTVLEVVKIAKAIAHTLHGLDRVVNPFNNTCRYSMNKII